MTGRELIDLIERNCFLDKEVYIKDGNGSLFNVIVGTDTDTKRDPYDGDWDTTVNVIELERGCVVKEG